MYSEDTKRGENSEVRQRWIRIGGAAQSVPDGGDAAELSDVQCDELVEPKNLVVREHENGER